MEDSLKEINLETVKKRTISGVIALTTRTFILQAISFAAFIFYGAIFQSSQFGTFVVVSAAKNFLSYFSDIGLAGALIQKKEALDEHDLKTTFFIQQVLVITLMVILFFITPVLRNYYQLTQEGVWLLWAFGISLFLSSLKTIPSVLLERHLKFSKLIIPQIIESIVFNVLVVVLATFGFGLTSFTVAILAQGFIGLFVMYFLKPWKPGFAFSLKSLKNLLKFGVPYQVNTFLAMIKDDGLTLFLGGILGLSGMGLLAWAQKWAMAPLRFFMDQVIKVTFPAYSRLQDNKTELTKAVSKSLFFVCFLVFPSLVGLVTLSPLLVELIPKYEQWKPALFALILFSVNAAWAAVATPLTNLFNAIGKIKTTFKLMVMWTVLTWALIPGLAYLYGINGAALGSALVASSSFIAILIAKKYVNFDLSACVLKPLIASLGMGIVLFFCRGLMPISIAWIITLCVFGFLSYTVGILFLVGPSVLADGKKVLNAIIKR